MDKLHEAAAITREDEGATGAEAIPEEGFAVVIVAGAIDEGRAQSDDRDVVAIEHAEEHAFAHGFVSHIGVGVIIWGERVGFVMVEPVAIGGDAGHEDVLREVAFHRFDSVLDLSGGGAAFPVVDVIENDVELFAGENLLDLFRIVAVGDDIADLLLERMGLLAVQDGDIVLLLEQSLYQQAANKLGSANHKDSSAGCISSG